MIDVSFFSLWLDILKTFKIFKIGSELKILWTFKKNVDFCKMILNNNFLLCGIQTTQLWTWISLKVIELELSYRHLGMIKILNFNLKKKLCKNIQKLLRECKNQEFCLLKFHVFLLFAHFLSHFWRFLHNFFLRLKLRIFVIPRCL